jgi:hypothetical protein
MLELNGLFLFVKIAYTYRVHSGYTFMPVYDNKLMPNLLS